MSVLWNSIANKLGITKAKLKQNGRFAGKVTYKYTKRTHELTRSTIRM